MTTLVTGAGLVGTSFAQHALARGEAIVFVDPEPRADFLRLKLGERGYTLVRKDVRDLPALIETIQRHGIETVVHTAGLIGGRVQQSLSLAFDINLGGTRNVAEAVRLCGVRRLVHISTFGVYDRRREANGPVTEDFPRGGERGYGNYKVAKEMILEAYANAHRFELIMLRPANVFGLGHFWSGSSGGQKMQRLIEAGLEGRHARKFRRRRRWRTNTSMARTWAAPSISPPRCRCRRRPSSTSATASSPRSMTCWRRCGSLCPDVKYEVEPGEAAAFQAGAARYFRRASGISAGRRALHPVGVRRLSDRAEGGPPLIASETAP